jgi:hypothetical protein
MVGAGLHENLRFQCCGCALLLACQLAHFHINFTEIRRYAIAFFIRRYLMGKYLIGWLLGVPVIVLVIIYLFFN